MKKKTLGKTELKTAAAELAASLGGHVAQKAPKKPSKKTAPIVVPEAKPEAAHPAEPAEPKTAPAPTVKPELVAVIPPKPVVSAPSLLDEILSAGMTENKVAEAITMANTILTDSRTVGAFVKAIGSADALFIQKVGFTRRQDMVRDELNALTFPELEKQLQTWSKEGDDAARNIVNTLALFKKSSVDITGPLWKLVVEIVRPANNVRAYYDLSQLLKELVSKGLAEKMTDRRHYPEKAIILGDAQHTSAYLPAMERGRAIPIIEAAWPWVKEAEGRAKEAAEKRNERLNNLRAEVNGQSLSYADAAAGKDGKVFLQTGPNSGLLLQVGENRARIIQAVGLMFRSSGWMALEPKKWAREFHDQNVFCAFEAWKKKS